MWQIFHLRKQTFVQNSNFTLKNQFAKLEAIIHLATLANSYFTIKKIKYKTQFTFCFTKNWSYFDSTSWNAQAFFLLVGKVWYFSVQLFEMASILEIQEICFPLLRAEGQTLWPYNALFIEKKGINHCSIVSLMNALIATWN